MSTPTRFARSFGPELAPRGEAKRGIVSSDSASATGRLVGIDDPVSRLRITVGSDEADSGESTKTASGVWIPTTLAEVLGVSVGDDIEVGIESTEGTATRSIAVIGVYAVGDDGRTPLDVGDERFWKDHGPRLPRALTLGTAADYAVITNIEELAPLGLEIGDTVLMTIDSRLNTGDLRLGQAALTRVDVLDLRSDLVRSQGMGADSGSLAWGLTSGVPALVEDSMDLARAITARTTTVSFGGLAVALTAVLAVGLLGIQARRSELLLEANLGLGPASVAARLGLELAPAAILGAGLGHVAAVGLIATAGQGAPPSQTVLIQAGQHAVYAVLGGLVLLLVVTFGAMRIVARPEQHRRRGIRLAWEVLLLVAASTALLGLLSSPDDQRAPVGLNLALPVLLAATGGAIGARVVGMVLTRSGQSVGGRALPQSAAAAVRLLALRRAASGLGGGVLIVTLLTTGLAVGGYSLLAHAAVERAVDDKVATASGAGATVAIRNSSLLDDDAPSFPTLKPGDPVPNAQDLPPRRQPPLPGGLAVVWRSDAVLPGFASTFDTLVIDPKTLDAAASWGSGRDLELAREGLATLAAAPVDLDSFDGQIPFIAVAAPSLQPGDVVPVALADGPGVNGRVIASIDTFPGYTGNRPMMVIGTKPLFDSLFEIDPRWRDQSSPFGVEVWSRSGQDGLGMVLNAAGVDVDRVNLAASVRQSPELAASEVGGRYQLGVAAGIVVLALLGTCIYADRRAVANPAGDLLLARAGLGRKGPARARVIEMLWIIGTSAALAAAALVGISTLGRRLLDPDPRLAPDLYLHAQTSDYLIGMAVLLLSVVLAVLIVTLRMRSKTVEEVLRDAD